MESAFDSKDDKGNNPKYIYLTATLVAAIWRAEFAVCGGLEKINLVEPTDPMEDDPIGGQVETWSVAIQLKFDVGR